MHDQTSDGGEVTRWLNQLHRGDDAAIERLLPLLYSELRSVARNRLRGERQGHTLETTALVHEAYLRLLKQRKIVAADRHQFLAIAGHTMRRVLVDYARARMRQKRGGSDRPVSLEEVDPEPEYGTFFTEQEASEMLSLDEALGRLKRENPEGAAVVELRFFGGLTLDETADQLGLSKRTVQRRWISTRAWLRKEIGAALDAPT